MNAYQFLFLAAIYTAISFFAWREKRTLDCCDTPYLGVVWILATAFVVAGIFLFIFTILGAL
jgi:hypothetical protein